MLGGRIKTYQAEQDDPWGGEEESEDGGDEFGGDLLLRAEGVEDLWARVEEDFVGVLRWGLRWGDDEVEEFVLRRVVLERADV